MKYFFKRINIFVSNTIFQSSTKYVLMKKSIFLYIYLSICLSVSLNGQSTNSQDVEKGKSIQRNATYNLEEIKVRWKKAALENCTGVPCIPVTVPGPPTSVTASAGNASASVAFVAPTNNGGSAITGYTVTSSPGGITATGTTSPINVTGLTNGTAYTFTIVATNAIGNSSPSTASSAVTPLVPFTCGTSTVADIDGNTYNTVLIGTQCWTKENLKVTKYNDGTTIPDETANTAGWGGLATGARSDYTGEASYIATYGYLYNWYAAVGIVTNLGSPTKNICPTGWHVPTDGEWTSLIQFIDPTATNVIGSQSPNAGVKLKSTSTLWNTLTPPNPGTDNYGFSALPGGFRNIDLNFFNIRSSAFFWSATPIDADEAWYRSLNFFNNDVYRNFNFNIIYKSVGASIRCLRD
jgi:uncharacterized protein (TIGR02145 family)